MLALKLWAIEWYTYLAELSSGRKSIALGVLLILYAIAGLILGQLPPEKSVELTFEGLVIIALRLGIKKLQPPK